jgi:hypothetical protein
MTLPMEFLMQKPVISKHEEKKQIQIFINACACQLKIPEIKLLYPHSRENIKRDVDGQP